MTDSGTSSAARAWLGRLGLCLLLAWSGVAGAADVASVRKSLLKGDYAEVIQVAGPAVASGAADAEWHRLLIEAQLATGKYAEAATAMAVALAQDNASLQLRWLSREVAFANGRPEEAAQRVEEIYRLFRARSYNSARSPADIVVFGRTAVLMGSDPKDVLEKVYAVAQKADPKLRDVYLARGELALSKHDFALAAKVFDEGLKAVPDDPELHFGRALAYANGDREAASESLSAVLKLNPRHVPALLQLVDNTIDGEDYAGANKKIDDILAINPHQSEAWAYRAVAAHLRNDITAEAEARAAALRFWPNNPKVDHLIGKKLSEKYRFAEGATYQRRAREFDPTFLPASAQLASDLLRLGEEEDGWKLAQAVHEKDEYDVEAFNLVTLRDTMAKYTALRTDDFVVRMHSREAEIYGPRVLALLTKAKKILTAKYGVELARPTYIEIFADQRDFAVRTFGLPDVAGFLGVCFGRVVTANSPAATGGHAVNWESVLWHEFCHAVTLQLTRNKMPRWLSEGISVYEERQADRAWGMRLNPRYREMIVKDDLVPVAKLSGAFLAPKSPQHLQFYYLESAMVVEHIVYHHGIDKLRAVLRDLATGTPINAALEKNVAPMDKLEKEFAAYAKKQADELAPGMDWTKPEGVLTLSGDANPLQAEINKIEEKSAKASDNNYWSLAQQARKQVEEQKWADAKKTLTRLVELYPTAKGGDTAYRSLAKVLRMLGATEAERATLATWCALDDEATDGYLRLMELAAEAKDWPTVTRNAERYLAVNPLVAPPWRFLAQAAAASGDTAAGVAAWRTLIRLDPPDPAEAHFQLARLLKEQGHFAEARRHVLLALEEAPRYRDALRLLLELSKAADTTALPVAPKSYVAHP
ncbi:MAG: tetratricopeptide repeat protein [Verrucomicrobia bacterium]|nr:tetratricopeptide repeat protein [Verrucomicrobiota bacterium]